jgi:biopolymer transport protein ExbD
LFLASSGKRCRALIGLTPLIDVVFILLIFFMLASNFIEWRSIELNVPGSAAGGPAWERALLVEVRPDGLRLSGESMPLELLVNRVGERVAVKADQRVLVKPSPGVPLQAAVEVLDRLSAIGVVELSLIPDKRG